MSQNPDHLLGILGICAAAAALSLFVLAPYFAGIGAVPKGPTVPGLRNWGNWCFCNSVLQSLAGLSSLRPWLDARAAAEETEAQASEALDDVASALSLSKTLLGLFRLLTIEGPAKTLSSLPVVQAVERIQQVRISRAQQDAQEFLHLLLESLAAEQNRLSHRESLQQMREACQKAGNAYVALPFEGTSETRLTCETCGWQVRQAQMPFLEWTLLPAHQRSVTLEACLAKMLQTEYIEDYNCAGCQVAAFSRAAKNEEDEAQAATLQALLKKQPDADLPIKLPRVSRTLQRKTAVVDLPSILAIHMNRSLFDAYATRNSVAVAFSEHLDLSAVTGDTPLSGKDPAFFYQLRSFVIHQGNHDRGHYIAFRKRGRQWLMISDETVRYVTGEQALEQFQESVFLLFYEKVDKAVAAARKQKKRQSKKRRKQLVESKLEGDAVELEAMAKM